MISYQWSVVSDQLTLTAWLLIEIEPAIPQLSVAEHAAEKLAGTAGETPALRYAYLATAFF